MKYLAFFLLIFFGSLLISIFSIEILNKYGKIYTRKGYVVFDSSSFSNGDKMYFTLSTDGYCVYNLDILYYNYLSSTNTIDMQTISTPYWVRRDSSSTTTVNGYVTSFSAYFTIQKKEEQFGDSNGNYLYLEFNCNSHVEIENTEESGTTNIVIGLIIAFVVFFVIMVIIIIVCCICRRKRMAARRAMMSNNVAMAQAYGVSPYGVTPIYGQQVMMQPYPYNNVVYAYQNPNMANMNNNMNFASNPNTIQVVQNGVNQQSLSNRPINQNYEKPKY